MSEENLEIVRQGLMAVLRPDPDFTTVNAIYHPDHEFVSHLDAVDGGSHVGGAGYRTWLAESSEVAVWESRLEDVRTIDEDRVLAVIPTRARGVASGAEVGVQRLACVVTVRTGKIFRTTVHGSLEEALESVEPRQ